MPNRLARRVSMEELTRLLGEAPEGDQAVLAPSYNIRPTHRIATIIRDHERYLIQSMHWGVYTGRSLLLSHLARDDKYLKPGRNFWARYERCAIPALGHYEWKGPPRRRQPIFVGFKDRRPALFAGLYIVEETNDGTPPEKVVLITTEPIDVVRPIHDRMAAILQPEHVAKWLDPDTDRADLADVLTPYPADLMEAWRVGTDINGRSGKDDPSLIDPV